MPGPWGRLTSVISLVVGISPFVRLAQAIFAAAEGFVRLPGMRAAPR
ncbi:hypothetical protein K6K41_01495 [Chenggangzhangella methanolivorans]|uniref:Uncharacterized protein n=1 Tax=Chenggangzhangella methanolivorans TaxID=1437009 RepID=A0A9E6RBW0_9HYPH|nr:hypothetical protein K6K41_01495 [Chenggangzhangella methanolivorans]